MINSQIVEKKKKQYKEIDYLYVLTPTEFEDAVMDMFRQLGFKVTQTPYSNTDKLLIISQLSGMLN